MTTPGGRWENRTRRPKRRAQGCAGSHRQSRAWNPGFQPHPGARLIPEEHPVSEDQQGGPRRYHKQLRSSHGRNDRFSPPPSHCSRQTLLEPPPGAGRSWEPGCRRPASAAKQRRQQAQRRVSLGGDETGPLGMLELQPKSLPLPRAFPRHARKPRRASRGAPWRSAGQ